MLTLRDKITEALSQENIDQLAKYIDDSNFNEYFKIIQRNAKLIGLSDNSEAYDKFFEDHGLSKLNFGRNNSAKAAFIKLFSENDKLDVLTQIVSNNGILSIKNLSENGNVFDLCKINGNDFSDEAKIIATWVNSTSASAGPCEMLLKFILKEGYTGKMGDVSIRPSEEMEVKASTIGKNASGGHAAGQKGNNGVKIRGAWAIYLYLNEHLFNIKGNKEADAAQYFQNKNGFAKFVKLLDDNNLSDKKSAELVTKTLVDAICFQYNYITNDANTKNTLPNIDSLYKSALNFYNNSSLELKSMLNLVGAIQLYLYSQIEAFDYFFCVMIDKNGNAAGSGNYWFVNDCANKLLDFNKVCNNINFGVLDSPTSAQGRTGKMYFVC